MNIETKKKGTNKWGGALIGAIVASGAAIAMAEDPVEHENPGEEVIVLKDSAHVLIGREGGYSWHYVRNERRYIDEQDFFARRLVVPFNKGKANPDRSCTTLTYHFSEGDNGPKLDLNTAAAQAYINAAPEPQKTGTLMQLQNTVARMARNDPRMKGPMSFSTTEACGPDLHKAYPEAVKKAEEAYKEAHSWTSKLKFW